jgi:hypothetical protein
MMQHDGLFGQWVEALIKKAKSGNDPEAAKKLMELYSGAIFANTDKDGNPYRKPSGAGTQIDERIIRYFGECFQSMLDGSKNPETAMNLKKYPNRSPNPS